MLLVGPGDAADPQTPQSPIVLGGKVLAITRTRPATGGTFVEGADPRILTFGHRNLQGRVTTSNGEGRDEVLRVAAGPTPRR